MGQKWVAEIIGLTYNEKLGHTRLEEITGDTPEMTEWVDFDMYDKVWYGTHRMMKITRNLVGGWECLITSDWLCATILLLQKAKYFRGRWYSM